jgi:hypothetical protein
VSRKPDAIDLVKLQAKSSHKEWNDFLTCCLKKHDLNKLALTRNRLQRGMNLAVKQKLSTTKLEHLFIRLQLSIENTMKQIIRKKYPNPCDDPRIASKHQDVVELKRKRDLELERYLRKTAF